VVCCFETEGRERRVGGRTRRGKVEGKVYMVRLVKPMPGCGGCYSSDSGIVQLVVVCM
jgi:hypothetical protein